MNQALMPHDDDVRDRDKTNKAKMYAIAKRHAKLNEIEIGDMVVAKRQRPSNKLATEFDPTVFKVIKPKWFRGVDSKSRNISTVPQKCITCETGRIHR